MKIVTILILNTKSNTYFIQISPPFSPAPSSSFSPRTLILFLHLCNNQTPSNMGRLTCSRNSVDVDSNCDRVRDFGDLRFSYAFCYCKKTAALRIVNGQGKPQREKLYFIRERKECSFFKWYGPNRDVEARACSSSTSVGGADFEELALNFTEIKKKNLKISECFELCSLFCCCCNNFVYIQVI